MEGDHAWKSKYLDQVIKEEDLEIKEEVSVDDFHSDQVVMDEEQIGVDEDQIGVDGDQIITEAGEQSIEVDVTDENQITTPEQSKQLECPKCNRTFAKQGNFKNHVKECTGKFKCKLCGDVFTQKGTLKRHEERHVGAKPFTCKTCH